MSSRYVVVSGLVFGFMAAAHAVRALAQWPAHVGGVEVPVAASWVAAVVAGGLSAWAFRADP